MSRDSVSRVTVGNLINAGNLNHRSSLSRARRLLVSAVLVPPTKCSRIPNDPTDIIDNTTSISTAIDAQHTLNGPARDSIMRQHGSLKNDAEINEAAWEAARGAAAGAAKVSSCLALVFFPLSISGSSSD